MKISFYTLGCKLNQAETASLKSDLENQGFLSCIWSEEDIAIVRACGVTCGASATTREMIRQAKRRGSYVVAVGCLENKDLKEIDFVSKDNYEIIEHLLEKFGRDSSIPQNDSGTVTKTRALVKIQTGCNFACTYCIITKFRGKSRSKNPEEIIKQILKLKKEGFKEVTLTGVNICQYLSHDLGHDMNLAELIKTILKETKISRIRLGSLDPRLITDELIKTYLKNSDRLLPHWHLSLQSGSNKILEGMARGYTQKQYFEIIKKLRNKNPLFSFTTDIIVGFPEETEENFKETCDFVKKCEFTKVHVFPYSKRPGTIADEMKNQVHDQTKKDRVRKLIEITNKVGEKFKKNFLDLERKILFEHKKDGHWQGFTPEYIRVKLKSKEDLENKVKTIKIDKKNLV